MPVTSSHGNFATETSSHGNFATLSEGEGRCGNIVGKCVGVWGEEGKMWEEVPHRYEKRCSKVVLGCGEVREDVGKGEGMR